MGSESTVTFNTKVTKPGLSESDMHGLTARQLSELQGAVQELDTYLIRCVDDLRYNRWATWIHPNAKHVADCLVRDLVVFLFFHSSVHN